MTLDSNKGNNMLGYKISLNDGRPIYVSIKNGVASIIFNCIAGINGRNKDELFVHMGGLNTEWNYHFNWIKQKKLKDNDKIIIEVTEVSKPSKIVSKNSADLAKYKNIKLKNIKKQARELGYELKKLSNK